MSSKPVLGLFLSTLLVTGCGQVAASPTQSPSSSSAESSSAAPAASGSASQSGSAASPSASKTASAAPTPDGPPVVVASPGTGPQVLGLTDAFDPSGWTWGSYTPAGEATAVQAMAAGLNCYNEDGAAIEYRFSQVPGTLVVEVAQDMRSPSTDIEVEFSLMVDDRPAAVENVVFTGNAELTTDLAGVTVVKVIARPSPTAEKECASYDKKGTTALITSIVVQQ